MEKISLDEYKQIIKDNREHAFKQPYESVYDVFLRLGYDKKNAAYFQQNASSIVEQLREHTWDTFKPVEKEFTANMLCKLIDEKRIQGLTAAEAITWYVENYADHIYALTLSNTQSRRSRAGKEFEAIIELLLAGASIPFDAQGSIGKKEFARKELGKLVDLVSPGVVQYVINKRDTVLISAKTTLRERWQEVPEEIQRTGAQEMFLATLDTDISDDVLRILYEANIQITTTESIKKKFYEDNDRVLSFEKLIEICRGEKEKWEGYPYKSDALEQIMENKKKQIEKHDNHEFLKGVFEETLNDICP